MNQELRIEKMDVFGGGLLAHGLEELGPMATILARKIGKLYAYKYTDIDLDSAQQAILEESEPEKHLPGVAVELMYFWETGKLVFDDSAVGIWMEEVDVPEVFRKYLGGLE